MKIKDILLNDYLQLKDTSLYDMWFEFIKPQSKLQGIESKTKDDLTFDEVSFLKKYIQKFDVENFKLLFKIFFTNFEQIKIDELYLYDFISWYKFISEELEQIIEIENTIVYESDEVYQMAGADKLERFGEMNTKITLGEQFGKLPTEIGKMLWADVVVILMYNAEKQSITKRYYELKNKIKS